MLFNYLSNNELISKNLNDHLFSWNPQCIDDANIIIESNVNLTNSRIQGSVNIGLSSYVNYDSKIQNASLGRFCSVAENVCIGINSHPTDWLSTHPNYLLTGRRIFVDQRHSVDIGNDVWIGKQALIFPNLCIGHGSIVAAHAVVTKSVPPYSIVAGVLAKIIKYRFPAQIIYRLLNICWWEYNLNKYNFDYSNIKEILDILEKDKNEGIMEI